MFMIHGNNADIVTRGATVTGCAPVVSFCCKGLYKYDKQSLKALNKNTERLKFQDFNICLIFCMWTPTRTPTPRVKQLLFCTRV